jgi:hypothetical protein
MTSRHYGLTSRTTDGGIQSSGSQRRANTHPANENSIRGSLRSESPLELPYPLQAALDVISVSFWVSYFLLWAVVIGGLIWGFFLLF